MELSSVKYLQHWRFIVDDDRNYALVRELKW